MRSGRTAGRLAAAVGAAVLALGASGCSGSSDDGAAASEGPDYDVIAPGEPGEDAETIAPEDVGDLEPEDAWNRADVAFMQQMIPHHAQALDMAELVPSRAASTQVKTLAERIDAGQGPEILTMASWLEGRGAKVPAEAAEHEGGHGSHGDDAHGDDHVMRGMLTDAEMAALADARGTAFDRLFLEGMIRHHQGAVDMAAEVQQEGEDVRVSDLANDVSAGQAAEIGRMRDLLAAL